MKKIGIILFLINIAFKIVAQQITVHNLQCNYKVNPIAINEDKPTFNWQIISQQRNVKQIAYRVLVADDSLLLTDAKSNLWDSKKINSDNSTQVFYAGKKLQAATKYYWKVQVFTNKNENAWSSIAGFRVGLLNNQDWSNAKWIGYREMEDSLLTVPGVHNTDTKRKLGATKLKQRSIVPLFRKQITITKEISEAIVYISGLGQYELNINAQKIGNAFLAPGWTNYDKRVLYNSYNVTSNLKNGENVLAAIVGNGFYNINRERYIKLAIAYGYPKLICKLAITYKDGSKENVVSDETWKTTPSPITYSSIFGGEDYDATLEKIGWNDNNYNDSNWQNAILVKEPKGALQAETDYPVVIKDALKVKSIIKATDSNYVYDFGQNLSGIIELKIQGKKGQTIKLIPAELLNDKNLANQNATGKPYYFSYTLKGDGVETWKPKFTYYGFRYVQVENAHPLLDTTQHNNDLTKIISLTSLHTSNSSPEIGSFNCSNNLFNNINSLIKWSIKSNLQSVVTDCPHREKLSWLEQDYLMGGSIQANYNVYHLYKKLVYDMMDAQTANGLVPDIAPEYVFFDDNGFGFRDSPEWGSASIIVPWLLYKWYGDKVILNEAYPMMQGYFNYLQFKAANNILDYGLGDWYDLGPKHPGASQLTPKALTATAIYYYDANLLSQISKILGKQNEHNKYSKIALAISNSFNKSFYNNATKIYANGSQTSMAMPLAIGLVAEKEKPHVFKKLVDSILFNNKKLTAGDIGFHFLLKALQQGEASQLIFEMNSKDDVPGYGFQLKKGATALTESWPALSEVSNNHLMLGHLMQWFYEGLGGINQASNSVGYKKIVIKPELVGDITFVNSSYQTLYGNVVSNWQKQNDSFTLSIQVPTNTTATVHLPTASSLNIFESNKPLLINKEIKLVSQNKKEVVVQVGSGTYNFSIKNKGKNDE